MVTAKLVNLFITAEGAEDTEKEKTEVIEVWLNNHIELKILMVDPIRSLDRYGELAASLVK